VSFDSLSTYVPKRLSLIVVIGLTLGIFSGHLQALEVGLSGLFELEASDNVFGANSPEEEDGVIQSGVLGIYGEQKGARLTGAFSGELDTRKVSSGEDSLLDSVSRFSGAAEFKITPRSWTWYAGNILGGIRVDNAVQVIDDADLERRNVFVTGPQFEYEQQGISRTSARALYVNQTEGSDNLETLYTASFRHERDLTSGSFYGVRLGNVFNDVPQDVDEDQAELFADGDFNRSTLAAFYNQRIGFTNVFGELGATRYDADEESLNGFNAQLRVTQELGPQTSASAFVSRDLNDQSLSAVESLIANNGTATGLRPDAAGFFVETRLGAQYDYRSTDTTVVLAAGVATLDYDLLSSAARLAFDADVEDRTQGFASASWLQQLSLQLRSDLGVSFETQEFDNRPDNSESLLLRASLIYQLNNSFELQFGVINDTASGLSTRLSAGGAVDADAAIETIDVTENRVIFGLRWSPPSRADRELIVELQSLLE